MHPLRQRRLWLRCGMGLVVGVVFLSLMHDPPHTHRFGGVTLGHFLAYAWLMFWFAQLCESAWARLSVAVALCTLGVALEFLQGFTGYRTFSYWDMRDNAFGVGAGLLLDLTPLRSTLAALENLLWRPLR